MKNYSDYSLSGPASGPGAPPRKTDFSKSTFGTLDFQNSDFTWEQVIRVLRKNRRFGLTLAGISIALIVSVVMLMKDVYQPVARVEIAPPMSGLRTVHEIESPADAENQDYLETQAQILKSDALAVSVIRELHLDRRAEFIGRHSVDARIPQASAEPSNALPAGDKAFLHEQIELATLTPAEALALEKVRKSLSVNAVHNTRLVEVSFASHDPQIARQVTNEVVTKFIENGYKHRYTTTTQASEWLASQLSDLRQKVVASTQAVSDYQRKYGLVEMDDRDVPLSQLMGEVNHQLSEAQASRIENEAYLRMIDLGQTDYVPTMRDDQFYQNLLIRNADLRTQLAQARAVYGDANTNVKKLEDQSAEIAKQIEEERKRIADRIRTAYSAAKERERLMFRSREKLRAQMGNVSSQLVGYHVLKNEAIANAELYNTLQARLREAGIYAGLGSNNIRVVDLAENLQKAIGPPRAALIAGGMLMSCLLGVFSCFFKESLNNTVRTPEDVKSWVGLKSLALLPVMSAEKNKGEGALAAFGKLLNSRSALPAATTDRFVALMKPLTAEAEAMRDLRTALFYSRMTNAPSVILISSSMEGEGKTTVAVNFAIALAQIGRTCLIDADLRQPMIARAFGIEPKTGLSDVLSGSAPLNNALVGALAIPNLWLLPSGSPVESPADALASTRMQDVCGALRKQFEFVVIDSPPVIRFSDARYLSQLADEVVLVGRYGITTRRAIQRSAELLQDVQAPLAGVVLNCIDLSSPDYHYFTYGYSKEAGKQNTSGSIGPSLPVRYPEDGQQTKSKGAHA
jgi:succinoglycan biosynthesis transport protein ExoP